MVFLKFAMNILLERTFTMQRFRQVTDKRGVERMTDERQAEVKEKKETIQILGGARLRRQVRVLFWNGGELKDKKIGS